MEKDFGKIVDLDLRDFFKNEATDFTPWLADHLQDIADLLSIEITDAKTEKDVGDFRIDITAKEARSNATVAIENQLEETDHNHLGQIMTYTAGLDAGIVIWISPKIRPEHEAVLNWLNEQTESKFFGIEIRIRKIGDSKAAPDFSIKVMPTSWTQEIKKAREGFSPRNQAYQEFFDELIGHFCKGHPDRKKIKALAQSWNGFGAGKSGFTINWVFTGERNFGVELYISTPDKLKNKDYFDVIKKESESKPDTWSAPLSWQKLDDKVASRIAVYTNGDIDTVQTDAKERERLILWGAEWMGNFFKHFAPLIKKL